MVLGPDNCCYVVGFCLVPPFFELCMSDIVSRETGAPSLQPELRIGRPVALTLREIKVIHVYSRISSNLTNIHDGPPS